jgi:hypothetical protein
MKRVEETARDIRDAVDLYPRLDLHGAEPTPRETLPGLGERQRAAIDLHPRLDVLEGRCGRGRDQCKNSCSLPGS